MYNKVGLSDFCKIYLMACLLYQKQISCIEDEALLFGIKSFDLLFLNRSLRFNVVWKLP